jgi:hypothetical protein
MDWLRMKHLLLVVEVLSPATARADRLDERRRYQEAGVPLYWIVEPGREQVEIWTPDAAALLPPSRPFRNPGKFCRDTISAAWPGRPRRTGSGREGSEALPHREERSRVRPPL